MLGPGGLALIPLVDDTGALHISIPASWSDIDTTPFVLDDVDNPYIEASTDRSRFLAAEGDEEYSVPGVLYRALDYIADTAGEVSTFVNNACADGGIAQYSDGVFTGHVRSYTNCAGRPTRQYVLFASPADHSFTALVIVQLTAPGDAEWLAIVDSFNYDPAVMATMGFGPDGPPAPA